MSNRSADRRLGDLLARDCAVGLHTGDWDTEVRGDWETEQSSRYTDRRLGTEQ